MKYLDPKEFIDEGYLHELNRTLLHPLGLALEVVVEADGTAKLRGIWDCRDDPEGICFADEALDPAKAARVQMISDARRGPRESRLGYWVQPVSEQEK